jgi:hypothetical protein
VLILLDENLLSKKLKKPFLDVGHTVQNVEDMGWRGTKDRELLALANVFPFDVADQERLTDGEKERKKENPVRNQTAANTSGA